MRHKIVIRSLRTIAWLVAFVCACQFGAFAQAGFDVASIKENTDPADGGFLRFLPGGGVRAQHILPVMLITIGHGVQRFQIVGAPPWVRTTYYDVFARPATAATREQTIAMLQPLLVDRFKLKFHRENRQVDGYALVRSRADRLGPDLHPGTIDCSERANAYVRHCLQGAITTTTAKVVGAPIWSLIQMLISQVAAPVNDETGLTGPFDFDLRWSNEVSPTDDARSIFTAVQEQLGLKLERRRVTTEVFVIDQIERPTPD